MNLFNGQSHQRRTRAVMALSALVLAFAMVAVTSSNVSQAHQSLQSTCSQILETVQKQLESCSGMDRDQVCYGNPTVTGTFADSANPVQFSKVGDIVDLNLLKTIQTAPLDVEHNQWGIAALKVQVTNLDGTSTGQAASFVIFGDTSFTNSTKTDPAAANVEPPSACSATTTRATVLRSAPASTGGTLAQLSSDATLNITGQIADGSWLFAESEGKTGWVLARNVNLSCDLSSRQVIDPSKPAQLGGLRAFYFSTGIGSQAECKDVPQGGFMVRSPTGRKVSFSVDGADVTIGSTVQFLKVNGELVVTVIEGEITITVDGVKVTVKQGQQVSIKLDPNDPTKAVGVGTPGPAQGIVPETVRCAVDPVIADACKADVPTNIDIANNPPYTNDDGNILRPDDGPGSSPNEIVGPKPPPPPPPAATGTLCGPYEIWDTQLNKCVPWG